MEDIINRSLNENELKHFRRIFYGRENHNEINLRDITLIRSKELDVEVAAFKFLALKEEIREQRIVKVALIQNSIVLPTDLPISDQRNAIFDKVTNIVEVAAEENVNIVCLQEAWPMPFWLCTQEKKAWLDFAESVTDGPSTRLLKDLAVRHKMVIISPIIEKDEEHEDNIWNTAVVINENGMVLGKHRKNHLPSVGSYSETPFYNPGNTGHSVFETKYGRIGVNICYGRHHPQNWLMFALNGAEIVFNPSATISEFGEGFWGIEARNAAIANSYYTCSINRVGTETFSCLPTGQKLTPNISRNYYGSSYVTAPDGVRTPSLSREKDGLLIVSLDLNLCRQVNDKWGFRMTARLETYAEEIKQAVSCGNYKN